MVRASKAGRYIPSPSGSGNPKRLLCYKKQKGDTDEQIWMSRIWDVEYKRTEVLGDKWKEHVFNVRAPLGAHRNKRFQTADTALREYNDQRAELLKFKNVMSRRGWLPSGRMGRLPNNPVALPSLRDEGPLTPTQLSCHSFVVAIDRDKTEVWIVDPLCLQPVKDLATKFESRDYTVHNATAPWPTQIAQTMNCSYLAVRVASRFPGRTDPFEKTKSMTEQHTEEQRATLQWMQHWSKLKAVPKLKGCGQYIPKRPRTVTTAEWTLEEGLRSSGYTLLSKEAMLAALARRSGRGPDVMKSVAAGPEPVPKPTDAGIEVRYCGTSRMQEPFRLVHPSCQRSKSSKEEHIVNSRWVVMLVIKEESGGALYMKPPGRPRTSEAEPAAESIKAVGAPNRRPEKSKAAAAPKRSSRKQTKRHCPKRKQGGERRQSGQESQARTEQQQGHMFSEGLVPAAAPLVMPLCGLAPMPGPGQLGHAYTT